MDTNTLMAFMDSVVTIFGFIALVTVVMFSIYDLRTNNGNRLKKYILSNAITHKWREWFKDDQLVFENKTDTIIVKELQKEIRQKHYLYGDYIILRFGSSVNSPTPNDMDYIVLLIGYVEKRFATSLGRLSEVSQRNPVDIEYRDYNSFMFSLISGTPFEHSIVNQCQFLAGNKGYFNWLHTLAKQVLIDPQYVARQLARKILLLKDDFNDFYDEGKKYESIIKLYYIYSTIVQIEALRMVDTHVPSSWIAKLGDINYLKKVASSGVGDFNNEFLTALHKTVKYFKEDEKPERRHILSQYMDIALKATKKEDFYG